MWINQNKEKEKKWKQLNKVNSSNYFYNNSKINKSSKVMGQGFSFYKSIGWKQSQVFNNYYIKNIL